MGLQESTSAHRGGWIAPDSDNITLQKTQRFWLVHGMHFCLKIQFHLRWGMPKPYQLILRLSSLLLCVCGYSVVIQNLIKNYPWPGLLRQPLETFTQWHSRDAGVSGRLSRPRADKKTAILTLTAQIRINYWRVKGNCIMIYVRATSSIGCISIYIL